VTGRASFPIAFSPDGRKAVLQVETESLHLDALQTFEEATGRLLETGRTELVVDMSPLARIHSGYIGVVLYASSEAREKGLNFSVAAGDKVRSTFDQIAPGLISFR
jgi:anti-anti-sigma regulatory factor